MKRRSPLVLNTTVPSRLAKIVSSRPMPVPGPGRKRVPRCLTMIVPAVTPWPAKTFTPSIFGLESRPFRDEPSPFLCAIEMLLPRFERRERTLALRVRPLVLQRRLDLFRRPAAYLLVDVGDGHVGVASRKLRSGLLLLRRCLLLRRGVLLRRASRAPDRLDLDLRELCAKAGMPAIAALRPVLADADLLAERRADHPRGHLSLRRELELALAPEHQHLRMEGLALRRRQSVDEQALAFLDAVLLPAE